MVDWSYSLLAFKIDGGPWIKTCMCLHVGIYFSGFGCANNRLRTSHLLDRHNARRGAVLERARQYWPLSEFGSREVCLKRSDAVMVTWRADMGKKKGLLLVLLQWTRTIGPHSWSRFSSCVGWVSKDNASHFLAAVWRARFWLHAVSFHQSVCFQIFLLYE